MELRTRVVGAGTAIVIAGALGLTQGATPGKAAPVVPFAVSAAELVVARPSHRAVFPLTITRTGGFAGFLDVLVVAEEGLMSVTQKGQEQWSCRLMPEVVERLRTAASQVPWRRITAASTQPAFPDDMVSMVLARGGGPVRLEDPRVGAAGKVFQELLGDLRDGGAPSLCKAV